MDTPSTQGIVDEFTRKVEDRLNGEMLNGPVRLDNTHTVVIIPLKGSGPIHAQMRKGVSDVGVQDILVQIAAVPSLKGLVKTP